MRALVLIPLLLTGCDDPPPREVVIRAGRLIDGSGAPVRHGVRVRIKDGEITAVEPDDGTDNFGEGVGVLDAREATVMPGLVNAHSHLFASGSCTHGIDAGPSQAIRNLHTLLRGGVTTVADLGAPAAIAVALRRHVGTGRGRGPRVFVTGPMLTVKDGYPFDMFGADAVGVRVVSSKVGARAVVRQLAVAGVDAIKVAVQESGFNGAPQPLFSGELLCAVVEEAHEQELRVLAHATTPTGYAAALDCGVDAIVHGCREPLDETLFAKVKAAGIPIAPTHQVFEAFLWGPEHLELLDRPEVIATVGGDTIADLRAYAAAFARGGESLPPFLMEGIPRAGVKSAVAANLANTRRLHQLGVPVGLGTDTSCFQLHGSPVEELLRLESAGLSRLEVLAAATHGGARILNLHEALGRVRVGYRADLIGIAGEPDTDLHDIVNVRWLMIDGVLQPLDGPGFGDSFSGVSRMGWAWMND